MNNIWNWKVQKVLLGCGICILFLCSCSISGAGTPPTVKQKTIWRGAEKTFTKKDGADSTQEANQDRITDNVWLTRGSTGELYNAKSETSSAKGQSPKDTEWAIGTLNKIDTLTFKSFRDTIKPKEVVGSKDKDLVLVLHLISDDIYLKVQFTQWSTSGKPGGKGGFEYKRSTAN